MRQPEKKETMQTERWAHGRPARSPAHENEEDRAAAERTESEPPSAQSPSAAAKENPRLDCPAEDNHDFQRQEAAGQRTAAEAGESISLTEQIPPTGSIEEDLPASAQPDAAPEPVEIPLAAGKADAGESRAESPAISSAPPAALEIAAGGSPAPLVTDAARPLTENPAGGRPAPETGTVSSAAPAPDTAPVSADNRSERRISNRAEIAFQLLITHQDQASGDAYSAGNRTNDFAPEVFPRAAAAPEVQPWKEAPQTPHPPADGLGGAENWKRPASPGSEVRSFDGGQSRAALETERFVQSAIADSEEASPASPKDHSIRITSPEPIASLHQPNPAAASFGTHPGHFATSLQQDAREQAAPAAPRHVEFSADGDSPIEGSSRPVRSMALEFGRQHNGRVSLHLTEKAGKVEVTVRSVDSTLNRALRGELGELLGRMRESGFEAQALGPALRAGAFGLDFGSTESPAVPVGSPRRGAETENDRRSGGGFSDQRGQGNREHQPGPEQEDHWRDPQMAAWSRAWQSVQQTSEVTQ